VFYLKANVNVTPQYICLFNVYLFIKENIFFVFDIFLNDIKVEKIILLNFLAVAPKFDFIRSATKM